MFDAIGRITIAKVMLACFAIASGILGLVPSASAFAPDFPMVFLVVRTSNPTCEPTCPEWIYAAGSIEPYSPTALRKVLKALGAKRLPVVLASNGGDRRAAVEIGRILRKRKLSVAIGTANMSTCMEMPVICKKRGFVEGRATFTQANCISSCPYIFAGGVVRLNNPQNIIGLHNSAPVYYSKDYKTFKPLTGKKAAEVLRKARNEKLEYLAEMGVNSEMEKLNFEGEVYEVPFAQQQKWGLVTGSISDQDFTDPQICKSDPLPVNCIERKVK